MLRSPLVVFVLLASAAVNFAQRPFPAQSPAAPARSAAPTPNLQEHVKLQFPNSDVQDVLRYYEQLTGKRVIMDNFVNGKVNIFLTKDPTREEAIQIIQISLLMNGFSLVPEEPDIIKVIGTGKNPRTQGVPIISDQADIPPGDQVVSFLFRLRYADPTELQQVIGQYLSPPSSYTSVLPLPKSSSILITENSTVLRGLAKIIEQIDVAPAEVTSEFIKLERADASKVVDACKIPYLAPSLGGPESLIEQPALMSYYDKSPEERAAIGIRENLIRMSIGLESAEDLIADLDQALAHI